jgi:hypothetical protein
MAINVFILDESRDWFLQQGRIDPMTRAQYKRGDRVVVCNSCHMVSLESTWNDCGGCTSPGCGGKVAARKFLKAPAPKNTVPSSAVNQIVLRNGRVERQAEPDVTTRSGNEAPKMVIKARHFYE